MATITRKAIENEFNRRGYVAATIPRVAVKLPPPSARPVLIPDERRMGIEVPPSEVPLVSPVRISDRRYLGLEAPPSEVPLVSPVRISDRRYLGLEAPPVPPDTRPFVLIPPDPERLLPEAPEVAPLYDELPPVVPAEAALAVTLTKPLQLSLLLAGGILFLVLAQKGKPPEGEEL